MYYLFLVNLGPVQEFIASARRSRDLWFGSWLLSELSKAAAKAIVGRFGPGSLIFPSIKNIDELDDLNISNRILAQIEIPREELATFAESRELEGSVGFAIYGRLHEIWQDALKNIEGKIDDKVATQQIDDMLEYFWAALPLPEPAHYKDVRKRLEALMAARKSTRDFGRISWGADQPKSSLDGSRESVIPESAYPQRGDDVQKRKEKIASLYWKYGAGQAERLSGVDLLKRHGNRGVSARFLSTSHMAALPLLQRLRAGDTVEAKDAWDQYTLELKGLNVDLETIPERYGGHPVTGEYDGGLLFASRLDELLESNGIIDDEKRNKGEKAREALRSFLAKATGGTSPLPYYVILLADGDSMGKAIDIQEEVAAHQALSKALNDFAESVLGIVEGPAHRGALIYAGGDDVLAFLPVHTALDCARKLADEFKDKLKSFKDGAGNSPTLSVGIVVSHHLEPLSEALALARDAEHVAKSVSGKNALAVLISKRSGADRVVRGTWGTLDERLRLVIKLHVDDAVPDGAAYQLRDMARRLTVPPNDAAYDPEQDAILGRAMHAEAIRILGRKQPGGTGQIDEETLKRLIEILVPGDGEGVSQLADELIVARDFAAAEEVATGKKEVSYANVDN